jgi:hypothetical protein
MTFKKFTLLVAGLVLNFNLFAQTRLGLFHTQEEVNIWKSRAAKGPYRNFGDVKKNSPGDWSRILENANEFVGKPSKWRWKGSTSGGCISKGSEEPNTHGTKLRDAAFAFLITGNTKYRDAVRNELIAQANEPLTNFRNTSRFCLPPNDLNDSNPAFGIAEWVSRLLVGYEYIKSSLTNAEREKLDAWFLGAGIYFQKSMDVNFNKRYTDRNNGNHSLSTYTINCEKSNPAYSLYFGGPKAGFLSQAYNNRRGNIVRLIGLVGISQNNAAMKKSAKLWFQEWLKFAVFPNGDVADLHRGIGPNAGYASTNEKGLNYAFSLTGSMIDLADAFARSGDPTLYNFTTAEGAFGTQGSSKSLKGVIKNLIGFINKSKYKYATANSGNTGKVSFLMDGYDPSLPEKAKEIVYDSWFAMANVYYKDSGIKDAYMRNGSGFRPYPEYPRGIGANQPWGGQTDLIPGVLFLFGQMEGKIWPYGSHNNATPTVRITAPSNGTNFTTNFPIIINADAVDTDGTVSKVEYYYGGTKIGEDTSSPFSYTWNGAKPGTYKLQLKAYDNDGAQVTSSQVEIIVLQSPAKGSILHEKWTGVDDKKVSAIPVNKTPNQKRQLSLFEIPSNAGDNYGTRVRGYVCPPITGNYTFWIASDDDGELWLSTNDSPNNKKKIALSKGSIDERQWEKFSSQQSSSVYLVAGRRYYVEALHKEGHGNDHLAVGWKLPNGNMERPIPGKWLAPYDAGSNSRIGVEDDGASLEIEESEEHLVIAYPNPFDDRITLKWTATKTGQATLSLTDQYGALKHQREVSLEESAPSLEMDLKQLNLRSGIYFLKIQSGLHTEVIRVIKK